MLPIIFCKFSFECKYFLEFFLSDVTYFIQGNVERRISNSTRRVSVVMATVRNGVSNTGSFPEEQDVQIAWLHAASQYMGNAIRDWTFNSTSPSSGKRRRNGACSRWIVTSAVVVVIMISYYQICLQLWRHYFILFIFCCAELFEIYIQKICEIKFFFWDIFFRSFSFLL